MPPQTSQTPRTQQTGYDVPLAPLTTMRVGGPAARLVTVTTTDELVDAVREVDDADEPLLVLGGGSNVVIGDDGFPGTVVRVATTGVDVESDDFCGGVNVRVAAGEPWDPLVERACAEGWSGVEALSGIPGSTGATPIQNVGAYGQEVAQTVAQVRVWDRQRQKVETVFGPLCGFGYRTSRFKDGDGKGGRYVVLDVLFQLQRSRLSAPIGYDDLAHQLGATAGERVPLLDAREAVLAQRRRRGMVLDAADHDTWSCGSFFTNPILSDADFMRLVSSVHDRLGDEVEPPSWAEGERVKTSAAWLIDRAGFGKGFAGASTGDEPRASLSHKHSLAVTNRGEATTDDVLDLARTIGSGVEDAFGVRLQPEPVLVGCSL